MKTMKRIMVLVICLAMLVPMLNISMPVVASDVAIDMPRATPTIDGDIEDNGYWSQAARHDSTTANNFWSGNAMSSGADIYFAYDLRGLYFASDITDNDAQSGLVKADGNDSDYGYNGDVMTLLIDMNGLLESSAYQTTVWYNIGILEDSSIAVYRTNVNDGDITSQVNVAGGQTEAGWCFELFIPWEIIIEDVSDITEGNITLNALDMISVNKISRASCMYLDRYVKSNGAKDTWGRYIIVCNQTYDGYRGVDTSGYTAKSFGIKLTHKEAPVHIWNDWQITKEADCNEEGTRIRTCNHCDEVQSEVIPKTDHSYGDWITVKEPTMETQGLKKRSCQLCGFTEQRIVSPSNSLIVAYYNASVAITSYEFHNIDVINFHPATIKSSASSNPASGDIITHNYTSRYASTKAIALEQNPDIKFLFTVANNNLSVFESWFYNATYAERLADEMLYIIEAHGFDGLDIDYEFPSGPNYLKVNFVHFMKTMRQGLDALSAKTGKEYFLTMAVPGTQWTFSLFDMNALAEYVTYFNMMNYDLYIQHGTTHHHTPSYDNDASTGFVGGSVYSDIQLYLDRGIPASKIVAGCGMYALEYKNVPNINNGLYQTGVRQNTNVHYTTLKYGYENKGGYVKYWDEKAGASYLYNANTQTFFTYDDERSVELKCKIVAEEGVRGIMVFDYCCTDGIGLFDNMRSWLDEYTVETDPLDQFDDVDKNAWYADAIRYCVTMGYAEGMGNGKFVPNGKLTRAQFVTLLAKVDGAELAEYTDTDSGFADVKKGSWFHNAVTWAAQKEYVAGMSQTKFAPNDYVTREQLVRILYNFAKDKGRDVSARADLNGYTDSAKISGWAYEELSWAVAEGIVSGMTSTTIVPKGSATRAQAMQIIKKFSE